MTVLPSTAITLMPASRALELASKLQALYRPSALHIVEDGAHVWLDQQQSAISREVPATLRAHGGEKLSATTIQKNDLPKYTSVGF